MVALSNDCTERNNRASCPFGLARDNDERSLAPPHARDHIPIQTSPEDESASVLPTGKARVKILYEEYIHVPSLRAVWETPTTHKPLLEPQFAAAFHGVELCFLLLSEFLDDGRTYVAKRPRIERVIDDIAVQCRLLTEIVDSELEEDGNVATERLSLTQAFPFPGAPPTSPRPSYSPGIGRMIRSVKECFSRCIQSEKNSLIKAVTNVTNAFFGSFQRWKVGLGVEWMLNDLRRCVGLPPLPFDHDIFLDYETLVRPRVVEATLREETYSYAEDFFFRSVHLGTECWAFIALERLSSAMKLAKAGCWDTASARIHQIARILDYLGNHIMMLTQMNLYDYLLLKVELEGTSGEGSVQVKRFRSSIRELFEPLSNAALALLNSESGGKDASDTDDLRLEKSMELVYRAADTPTLRPLYTYAKSLEDAESSLRHFFCQHFFLALNVIGSDARGTMRLPVQALKRTYEKGIFPELDQVRSRLGATVDLERAGVKGRIMEDIIRKYVQKHHSSDSTQAALSLDERRSAPESCPFAKPLDVPTPSPQSNLSGETRSNSTLSIHVEKSGSSSLSASQSSSSLLPSLLPSSPDHNDPAAVALRNLYVWKTPSSRSSDAFRRFVADMGFPDHPRHQNIGGGPLDFLDHAWGKLAPGVFRDALDDLEALYRLGNPMWGIFFEKIVPEASRLVCSALEIPDNVATVHFGSNAHELSVRLLSQYLVDQRDIKNSGDNVVRILTSDCEFYSISRQLNRLVETSTIDWQMEPAEPAATFTERILHRLKEAKRTHKEFDVVYVSQVTYLKQQTLFEDVAMFVNEVHDSLSPSPPLVVVDGYHAFLAFPTALGQAAAKCCYIGGFLKHAGCGANGAFVTLPQRLNDMRPAFTGWLADPSILVPGSHGFKPGDLTKYDPKFLLQGGTPSFVLPLLVFIGLQQAWKEAEPSCITVRTIHSHVLALQNHFLAGIRHEGRIGIIRDTLVLPLAPTECRSHTLVFEQPTPGHAKDVVELLLREHGILVDCRENCVRVGFGPYHEMGDVRSLLEAVNNVRCDVKSALALDNGYHPVDAA